MTPASPVAPRLPPGAKLRPPSYVLFVDRKKRKTIQHNVPERYRELIRLRCGAAGHPGRHGQSCAAQAPHTKACGALWRVLLCFSPSYNNLPQGTTVLQEPVPQEHDKFPHAPKAYTRDLERSIIM